MMCIYSVPGKTPLYLDIACFTNFPPHSVVVIVTEDSNIKGMPINRGIFLTELLLMRFHCSSSSDSSSMLTCVIITSLSLSVLYCTCM